MTRTLYEESNQIISYHVISYQIIEHYTTLHYITLQYVTLHLIWFDFNRQTADITLAVIPPSSLISYHLSFFFPILFRLLLLSHLVSSSFFLILLHLLLFISSRLHLPSHPIFSCTFSSHFFVSCLIPLFPILFLLLCGRRIDRGIALC